MIITDVEKFQEKANFNKKYVKLLLECIIVLEYHMKRPFIIFHKTSISFSNLHKDNSPFPKFHSISQLYTLYISRILRHY